MYFPYFFGRQSELLALRDIFRDVSPKETIVPIIEPVRLNPKDLLRCMNDLGKGGMSMLVIVNPAQGEFKAGVDSQSVKQWRASLDDVFGKYPNLLPTYSVGPNTTLKKLEGFSTRYPNREHALLFSSPAFSSAELKNVTDNKLTIYCGCFSEKVSAANRAVFPVTKIFEIQDGFNKLKRNSDYDGSEFFTDRHLNFRKNSVGFGDYLTLGSILSLTGAQPHAIAIHAVFKKSSDQSIWVEHFVSDDIDKDVGTVGGKYLQAVGKLVVQIRRRRTEYGDNEALRVYESDAKTGGYPGLPTNKRRQIRHHLSLMHQLLVGEI